jgi:predicted O-methyltransferase YrrM
MATSNRYQNVSLQFSTCTAGSVVILDILGNPIGTVTTTLLNNLLAVVLPALCTITQIDVQWAQPVTIAGMRLMARTGSPNGKLYIIQGPASTNLKLVQNFDMAFLDAGPANSVEFHPYIAPTIDVGTVSADEATTRITIKGHTALSIIPYQIIFETEEYT